MKRKFIFFILLLFANVTIVFGQGQADTILNRYREYLFRTSEISPAEIKHWILTINEQGQWPDINYKDESRANWQLWDHLKRLDQLAIAWAKPVSPFYHQQKLWRAIELALNNWLSHKYQNPNWWHNQIGVPQCMRDFIILLRDTLSPAELKQSLEIMDQLKVQKNGAGANLIWSADLGLHYGALTNNVELIVHCRQLILNEIKISTGEGIQQDFSFHQHGPRLQMYEYGKAFFETNIRLAWELRNTQWAFPDAKVNLLTDFLIRGWQWMARGINTVPGTIDRSVSRVGELHSADIRPLIPFFCELAPDKSAKFKAIARQQNGKDYLSGFRYYPSSDFTAYQLGAFSFFLKTISIRTLPTEVGLNKENLKGQLLNSGDAYLIRNGQEYYNLMPVWNWQKLPGISAFENAYKIKRRDFAGSVGNGSIGLSAMDYFIENKTGDQFLSAHKIWACHNHEIICLIAGLKAENIKDAVYTILDQCRLQGKVSVNNPGHILKNGTYQLHHVKWIYHAGFAYIPLSPANVKLKIGIASGRWSDINASGPNSLIKDNIFMPQLLYNLPKDSATGYALAYCKTAKTASKIASKPDWKILENNKDCQALSFPGGSVMAAFFQATTLSVNEQSSLSVDKPCLILISNKTLYASDPGHQGGILHININGRSLQIQLPQDGSSTNGIKLNRKDWL